MYKKYIKRVFDILCALMALVVFSWLYLIVASLVRVKLGKPVIFKQHRPGKDGKIFTIYKYRTMKDLKDASGNLLPDGDRMTKFGRFLRSTSLDELPEAFNILKGDMSVVGPRPLLVEYLPLYNERQRRRHEVRPGLSGLSQINGRNAISWEEKFEYDIEYIEEMSFWLDLKIIAITVKKAFMKREGVSHKSVDTMPMFRGAGNLENDNPVRSLKTKEKDLQNV